MTIISIIIFLLLIWWATKPIARWLSNNATIEKIETAINQENIKDKILSESNKNNPLKVSLEQNKLNLSNIPEYKGDNVKKFIFRPSDLKTFIGQEQAKNQIKLNIKKINLIRPVHFLISSIQGGVGKTTLAFIIANLLNANKIEKIGTDFDDPKQVENVLKEINSNPKYTVLIVDECLPQGTLIVKEDGGIEEIQNLKKGRLYKGGKILDNIERETNQILKIYTSLGIIETTPTHLHLIYNSNNDHNFKETNIMLEQAKYLQKGDYLVSTKYIPHTTKYSWSSNQLAFVGLLLADGCLMKSKYKDTTYYLGFQLSFKKSTHYAKALDIINNSLYSFEIAPTSYTCNKNRDYIIRIYGKEFCNYICNCFSIPFTKKRYNTIINDQIFYSSLKSIKTFIDTILYFEGWKILHHKYLSMCSKKFIYQFQLLLKKFGIASSICEHLCPTMKQKNLKRQYKLTISTQERKQRIYKNKEILLAKIRKIEVINIPQIVYDYTTENHLFCANGFITHNCHNIAKKTAEQYLYRLMEDFTIQGKKIKPFTIVGATTDKDTLQRYMPPFLRRFEAQVELVPYTIENLIDLLQQYKTQMFPEHKIKEEIYKKISLNCKFNPALAIAIFCDYIVEPNIKKILNYRRIVKDGLTEIDINILKTLYEVDKPIGEEALAQRVKLNKGTYRLLYEPFLAERGYLIRSTRGRVLGKEGKKILEAL